jgi:hypothetical protein
MLRVAFAAGLEPRVRAHLRTPCDVVLTDEAGLVPRMPDLDVVVTSRRTSTGPRGASRR